MIVQINKKILIVLMNLNSNKIHIIQTTIKTKKIQRVIKTQKILKIFKINKVLQILKVLII
jgi:hypothetical protein